MTPEVTDQLHEALKDAMHVPPEIPIWKWAENNIIIPRRSGTPFPGPYRTNVTPWVKEWFEALQNPHVNTVVIEKGAQIGATQTMYCYIMYCICEDPDPILIVMPAADDAREASRLRVQPTMEESPRVAQEMTGNPDDMNLMNYRLKNASVRWVGSNSPGKLASFPHRYLIMDETDKFKENIGREGSTTGLAEQRTKQFWNRKRVALSTPTTKQGRIHKLYLRGDQRKLFVACPHCGHEQILVWTQVKFDSSLEIAAAAKTAYYECESCEERILDKHKKKMVLEATRKNNWRPTATPSREGYRSYHISGLYSNSDECTFVSLVEKFLSVKDNPADLQDFINSDLGELWEERPISPVEQKWIFHLRDRLDYKMNHIPTVKPVLVGVFVDVQQYHLEWAVYAFRPREMYLVAHGTCSTFEELDVIQRGPYITPDGKQLQASFITIDSGYRTTEVYTFAATRSNVVVVKGDTGGTTQQTHPVRIQPLEKYPDGRPLPPSAKQLRLYHIHPTYFRDDLMTAITPMNDEQLEAAPLVLYMHNSIDHAYADQVTGEVPMEGKPDKFGKVQRYYKRIRANHQFDILHYAITVRWLMRKDLMNLDIKSTAIDQDETVNSNQEAPNGRMNPVKEVVPKDDETVTYGAGEDDGDDWGEW